MHACSLNELVKHDVNGLVFSTEAELEQQLEVISGPCITGLQIDVFRMYSHL